MPRSRFEIVSLGWVVALMLLLVAGGFSFNLRRLAENEQNLSRSQAGLRELKETFSLLQDAETGQRGYLLTGKARYLEPYRTAIASVSQQVNQLRQSTQNSPQQQAQIRRLEPTIDQKLAELQATIKLRQTPGLEAEKAALRLVQTDRGQQLMDSIWQQVTTLETEQKRLIATRSQELSASWTQTWLTFLGLNGLASLLLALVLYWIWRDRCDRQAAQQKVGLEPEIAPLPLLAAGELRESIAPEEDIRPIEPSSPSIDLLQVIEDSLRHLAPQLQARDVEVRVAQPLSIVLAQRSALVEIVTPLIDQALTAVPSDRRPVISIYTDKAPNSVCLSIEDNSASIVPAHPGSMAYSDPSHPNPAVLAIVRDRVERLGGLAGVESQVGQGNRFWIILPTPDC